MNRRWIVVSLVAAMVLGLNLGSGCPFAAPPDTSSGPTEIGETGDTAVAAAVVLAATGQTTSYVDGDDGDVQSGEAIDAAGRFVDNGDGTITDQLTGLMWLQDASCLYRNYPTWEVDGWADGWIPWTDALLFIEQINSSTLSACAAGYTDWRLPNVNELESLINAGVAHSNQWLMSAGFMGIEANDYWTSTSYADGPTVFAYTVDMDAGGVSALGTKASVITSVWPVRGTTGSTTEIWKTGQTTVYADDDDGDIQAGTAPPNPRFSDNGDGTITDNLTGLMWLQDFDALSTGAWGFALQAAERLNTNPGHFSAENYTATYTDWRTPNRKELYSLCNFSQAGPALDSDHPFIGVSDTASYWSSTTHTGTPSHAWHVDLRSGEISTDYKINGHRVTAVR